MKAKDFNFIKQRLGEFTVGQQLTEDQTLKLLCLLLMRTKTTNGKWKIFNFAVTDLKREGK